MAAQLTESLKIIENDIIENGSSYEFFQAYRILQSINDTYPITARRSARKIDVRPELSLGYAESDISEVKLLDKQRGYEVVSQLAGLYGVASPLPDFYTEELLDNEWDDIHAPREFLDLLHKQLFPKLYSAWRLYKLNFNTIEKKESSYWHLLYSLLGDTDDDADESIKNLKLRYFNLFSNKERSTDGLLVIIRDLLDIDSVHIEEFCQQTVKIPQPLLCQLGQRNHQLGEAHIGCEILDQDHAIKIKTGDILENQYIELIKNKIKFNQLSSLIKSYVRKPLQVDIEFDVIPQQPQIRLGEDWNQLGVSSYLASKNPAQTKRIILNVC
jgi:type VI secretion system protein ImpH